MTASHRSTAKRGMRLSNRTGARWLRRKLRYATALMWLRWERRASLFNLTTCGWLLEPGLLRIGDNLVRKLEPKLLRETLRSFFASRVDARAGSTFR
jgi:hypothetical protein